MQQFRVCTVAFTQSAQELSFLCLRKWRPRKSLYCVPSTVLCTGAMTVCKVHKGSVLVELTLAPGQRTTEWMGQGRCDSTLAWCDQKGTRLGAWASGFVPWHCLTFSKSFKTPDSSSVKWGVLVAAYRIIAGNTPRVGVVRKRENKVVNFNK